MIKEISRIDVFFEVDKQIVIICYNREKINSLFTLFSNCLPVCWLSYMICACSQVFAGDANEDLSVNSYMPQACELVH